MVVDSNFFFLFVHCLRPVDQHHVYKCGKILVFQSNCAEYDFRSKSLLLWQSVILKGRLLTNCNIANIFSPHMANSMCHSSWPSFDSVVVTVTGGRRQATEHDRQTDRQTDNVKDFTTKSVWILKYVSKYLLTKYFTASMCILFACLQLDTIILVINQLNVQNLLLYASTCFEQYVLIIRWSKLYYTASGIVTPAGGRPVHRLGEDPRCCIIQFWPPGNEHTVLETCRGI